MLNSLGYRTDLVFRDGPNPYGIVRKLWPEKRVLPKIFIIGAQKSGTTTLYALLRQHPFLIRPKFKEPFFFGNDDRFQRGLTSYLPNFPTVRQMRIAESKTKHTCMSIDATTNYLDHEKAAERIKTLVPDAKIIVLLRNPIVRAHSHYKMAVRNGLEQLNFAEALEKEDERIRQGANSIHNYCTQRLGYRTRGEYARLLPPWLKTFDQKKLLILCAEDFFLNTEISYNTVLNFLDLPSQEGIAFTPYNISPDKKIPDEKSMRFLASYFEPWNKKLEMLLNRKFPWNANEK